MSICSGTTNCMTNRQYRVTQMLQNGLCRPERSRLTHGMTHCVHQQRSSLTALQSRMDHAHEMLACNRHQLATTDNSSCQLDRCPWPPTCRMYSSFEDCKAAGNCSLPPSNARGAGRACHAMMSCQYAVLACIVPRTRCETCPEMSPKTSITPLRHVWCFWMYS